MNQWYFSVDGNQQGPLDDVAAIEFAKQNPTAHCWRHGFADWKLASEVPELTETSTGPVALMRPAADLTLCRRQGR